MPNDKNSNDLYDVDIDVDKLYDEYINTKDKEDKDDSVSKEELYKNFSESSSTDRSKKDIDKSSGDKKNVRTRYKDTTTNNKKTKSERKEKTNTKKVKREDRLKEFSEFEQDNNDSTVIKQRKTRSQIRKEYYEKERKIKKAKRRKTFLIFFIILIVGVGGYFGVDFLLHNNKSEGDTKITSPTDEEPTHTTTTVTTAPPYIPEEVPFPHLDDDGDEIVQDEGIFIWGGNGFNCFKGTENSALNYAKVVSDYKVMLGPQVKVYNMVVPNSTEYNLPQRFDKEIESNSERDNLTVIYSNYLQDVKNVDIYNVLGENRDEYIYYHTDSNWTTLGAYYAYCQFMNTIGITPIDNKNLEKNTIDNFYGDFATFTLNTSLLENPDNIDYYNMGFDVECSIYTLDGYGNLNDTPQKSDSMYKKIGEEDKDYSTALLYGDHPLTVIENKSLSDGGKLLLVKDSYGNAIAPYLANNFKEVHMVDIRYYNDNIVDYCSENEINNVLILNGIMSANSALQVDNMGELIK